MTINDAKKKTVSIAMCTYNGGKFLKEQLVSILSQTHQPDEIIICDDQSQDNTVDLAESILSEWNGKWQVIVNDENIGFKKNFQKAMSLCTGDIIFLSDQDDVWSFDKIEKMLPTFDNQEVLLSFHDATLVDEYLNLLYPSFWKTLSFDIDSFQKEDFRIIFSYNVMQGASCCFRKELYQIAKPFPNNVFHDEWLLLVALCSGVVVPVDSSLLKYRQAQNVVGGMPLTTLEKIKKWLATIHEATKNHFTYIEERNFLYSALGKHFISNQPGHSSFYKQVPSFELFLKQRLLATKHIKSYPKKSEYEHWYPQKIAKKQRIKDYLLKLGF